MRLSEEQTMIRDAVREFVRGEIAPHAARWDKTCEFPAAALKGLAALGCYGVAVPEPQADLTDEAAAALRRGYLDEARRLAASLEERWRKDPPRWNPPTGDAMVDGLTWFKYVNAER